MKRGKSFWLRKILVSPSPLSLPLHTSGERDKRQMSHKKKNTGNTNGIRKGTKTETKLYKKEGNLHDINASKEQNSRPSVCLLFLPEPKPCPLPSQKGE